MQPLFSRQYWGCTRLQPLFSRQDWGCTRVQPLFARTNCGCTKVQPLFTITNDGCTSVQPLFTITNWGCTKMRLSCVYPPKKGHFTPSLALNGVDFANRIENKRIIRRAAKRFFVASLTASILSAFNTRSRARIFRDSTNDNPHH